MSTDKRGKRSCNEAGTCFRERLTAAIMRVFEAMRGLEQLTHLHVEPPRVVGLDVLELFAGSPAPFPRLGYLVVGLGDGHNSVYAVKRPDAMYDAYRAWYDLRAACACL